MRDVLLAAARALQDDDSNAARNNLRRVPLGQFNEAERLVAIKLWMRLVSSAEGKPLQDKRSLRAVLTALDRIGSAATNKKYAWHAYEAIPILEKYLGAVDTAAIVASTIWDCVLKSNPVVFTAVFALFFRGGGDRCVIAMEQFLAAQRHYAPIYWDFILIIKSSLARSHAEFAGVTQRLLERSGRTDLAPLFDLYLKQMRQAPVLEIVAAARDLTDVHQRNLVARYMSDMGYTLAELRIVAASIADLAGQSDSDKALVGLVRARLAIAEHRWHDAIECAETAGADPHYRCSADLLRALALARLKQVEDATALLDTVAASSDADQYHRARGTFIRVTTELIARGLPPPEDGPGQAFSVTAGKPLAQSLWIGPKLRWIERLCIKSYLDNGWRFQLYVYDEPDDVPDGCELLDAAAIIPEHEIFLEGQGSEAHAGSVGAFSDLFRYRLLSMRGGMWTDTDVINFKKYDPDGQKFVCAEFSDAGLITLNGAIMAAPAGDELVVRAYERARVLLASAEKMFFTRIGPYLLAEVIIQLGVDRIEIMPPGFLGPVSWMNTASLLQPFDQVMARREFQQAANVHVYTEMWRTLGLGLDRPPSPQTFLGRLYVDHFADELSMQKAARP